MMNHRLTKFDLFLVVTSVIHTGLAVTFLVFCFINKNNYCEFNMYSLFFLTSFMEVLNINIIFRLKKSNLYDPKIRARYKWILFMGSVGKILNTVLSVTWWSESNANPVYCSLVTDYGLSPKLGILYEFYCLFLWVFMVIALRVYTKRKFFLIAVGGPEGEMIRENLRNLQLNIGVMQVLIENIQAPQYHNFEDNQQLPVIPDLKEERYEEKEGENTECFVCLENFKEDAEGMITRTKCGHIFHLECARQWLLSGHPECPACRTVLY